MKINKSIGIIGGVGPQATQYLYGKIIELAQQKYGAKNNDDFPHLIIESLPIPDFISNKNQVPVALKMLLESVSRFAEAKVDKICIASNTVHILLPELRKVSQLSFLSMVDLVSEKCQEYGYQKVALLGTPVLTQSNVYDKALNLKMIELIKPDKEDFKIVEEIIRAVIAGNINNLNKEAYINVINKLFKLGAQGIVLGCTELPLAINYDVLGKRIINSDEVLAEGIVDYYYL
jgi:aspartate racemase